MTLALGALLPGQLLAAGSSPVAKPAGSDAVGKPAGEPAADVPGKPYAGRSDDELTALAADWDALDRHQRRALLTEIKLRMARNGERKGVIHIRTERRYGRIIRQSDGRVIRIETQVVRVRPVNPEDLKARQSFGVGFEHRIGRREEPGTAQSAKAGSGAAPRKSGAGEDAPTLEQVLDSLEPSTQAPPVELPVYQVSDPES